MAAKRSPWWFGEDGQAGGGRRPSPRSGMRASGVLGACAAVGGLSAAVAVLLGHDPMGGDGWLGTRGVASHLLSLGLGVCLGAVTIAATRAIVRRAEWAR